MKDRKNNSRPRWLNLTIKDGIVIYYWLLIFFSFTLIFSFPFDIGSEISVKTVSRKIITIIIIWVLSITCCQTLFGLVGVFKGVLKFVFSPLLALKLAWGFLRDSRQTFIKIIRRVPIKLLFFISLPITIAIGVTESNHDLLAFIKSVIVIQIFGLMYFSFQWIFNPVKYVELLGEMLRENTIIKTIINGLSIIKIPHASQANEKTVDHVKNLDASVIAVSKILKFLSKPAHLFMIFLLICVFNMLFFISGFATIFKIEDQLSGFYSFSGPFFNGEFLDYVYITVLQFSGSDLHGINIQAQATSIKPWLVLLPFMAIGFLTFLLSAFSIVTQSKTEAAFEKVLSNFHNITSQAVEKISKNPTIEIVKEESKEKKNIMSSKNETTNTQDKKEDS